MRLADFDYGFVSGVEATLSSATGQGGGKRRARGHGAENFEILEHYNGMKRKVIETYKDPWERGFAVLSKFRKRERHCCPSRYHVEGKFKLGQWVSVQRYHRDQISRERKRRLNTIGFVWDWIDYRWEQGFAALLKFKRREAHCCVPIFHNEGKIRLGWWVSTQRVRRRELSAERKARLNKIGFVWNVFMDPIAYRPTPLKGGARLGKSKEAGL